MLIGHRQLIKDFKQLAKSGRLGQSYLFFGEPEVGKFYFAKHLVNFLENGEFEIGERPPQDAMIVAGGGIEEMRALKQFLWQKPAIASKRTAVINNADGLTPEAQNAILKITEEPPEHALLVLVADQPENLLPPLLSRLQKIYFGRLKSEELEKLIKDPKITRLAFGRPGRAMKLKNNPLFGQADKYAANFLKSGKRSELIKALIEEQKEQPELLDWFFECLLARLGEEPVKNWPGLKSILHRFFLIKSYNTNKRLQLEAII